MLILKQWLPESPSRLPLGPTHQVGVGALVLEEDKMLVVQEKSGPAAGNDMNALVSCDGVLCLTMLLTYLAYLL